MIEGVKKQSILQSSTISVIRVPPYISLPLVLHVILIVVPYTVFLLSSSHDLTWRECDVDIISYKERVISHTDQKLNCSGHFNMLLLVLEIAV